MIAENTPKGLLLRPAVTLPVEVYAPERERDLDLAKAELATERACKPQGRFPRKTQR